MLQVENAIIESTMLGREDHGIMTCFVFVTGDGWSSGMGGFALDEWNEDAKKRVGSGLAAAFIMGILDAVGVERWEDLPGKHVRVKTEGWGGGIAAIGHIIEDKWFEPRALREEWKRRKAEQGAPQKPVVDREWLANFLATTFFKPYGGRKWGEWGTEEQLRDWLATADAAIAAMGGATQK